MSNESASGAATARPDAAPTKDAFDRLVDLIEEYAIDERAHAREAYCEPPGHNAGRERAANSERLQSHAAVLGAIAALRFRLAEGDAECERLRLLSRTWHFLADHLSSCLTCWDNGENCYVARTYAAQIHELEASSAAVAPAARETQETNDAP